MPHKQRKRHSANGEGGIRRRADGLYEARLTVDGVRRSHYGTRGEVSTWLVEQRCNRDRGLPIVINARTTLAAYLEDWLERVEPRLRPSTHRRYRELASHLSRHLGSVPIARLTAAQIGRCYATLRTREGEDRLSQTTVHHCHAVLRKALGDAVREGVLARNVATLVVGVPMPAEFEPAIWSIEHTRAFLAAIRDEKLGPLYLLAACTGMRNAELRALRWQDIDLDAAHLQVRQAFQRGKAHQPQVAGAPKTKAGRRRVELPLLAVAALRAHRARQAEERLALGEAWHDRTGLVFTSAVGTPLDGVNLLKQFYALLGQLGLPRVRLHDLRHLQATILLAAGVHPKVVAERLGHSRVEVTLGTYSHVAQTLQREAADVLDRLLGAWEPAVDSEATGERGQG
jgi:integrase